MNLRIHTASLPAQHILISDDFVQWKEILLLKMKYKRRTDYVSTDDLYK